MSRGSQVVLFTPVLQCLVVGGSLLGYDRLGQGSLWLVFCVFFSGASTFWAFLQLRLSQRNQTVLNDRDLRAAIAAGVILAYLCLVAIGVFFRDFRTVGEQASGPVPLPLFASTLLTNFTTVVGIVVAFYFGSSAYLDARSKADEDRNGGTTSPGTGEAAQPSPSKARES